MISICNAVTHFNDGARKREGITHLPKELQQLKCSSSAKSTGANTVTIKYTKLCQMLQ